MRHTFIVRQIERSSLHSLCRFASDDNFIHHTNRRKCPEFRVTVFFVDGKIVFQLLQRAAELCQLLCLFIIAERDERLERRFVIEHFIHIYFIRTNRRLDWAVEIHPRDVAGIVIIADERVRAFRQECFQ